MTTAIPDIISKKRDGLELSNEDIQTFIRGVANDSVADCQTGAMLMAIFLNDMTRQEAATMTLEMKNSGTTLDWPEEFHGHLVDKHSTGGVGDKTSLILAPALAACGLKVPMISGRGLGHTGGTLDKLESIPGYNVSLTADEMVEMLKTTGCFIAGQTGDICPADKKTYRIRDVTSTVKHQGLINCSIVSKKAAENINTLVLDVKTGSGAFMSELEDAKQLARAMVNCSKDLGIKTISLLNDMDSPLGNMVGNALEVAESIWCLQGKGPADLLNSVIDLGGYAIHTHDPNVSIEEAKEKISDVIANGSALKKFKEMIQGQGSQSASDLCDPNKDVWSILPTAKFKTELKSTRAGYVENIIALPVAMAGHRLGGGRNAPGDAINMSVGLELLVDIGDQLTQGQSWIRVHHEETEIPEVVMGYLSEVLIVSDSKVPQRTRRLVEVIE